MLIRRFASLAIPFAILSVNGAAFAQDDSSSTPVTETSTGGYVPPADPALNETRPGPSRPSCTWSGHPCAYPHLVMGVDGGFSHLAESNPFGFGNGVGSITSYGPDWGARVGAEFTPWFALEAHYIGMWQRADASVSVGGRRGLLTNAGALELRFTAPLPLIQPYVFVGGGVYSTSVTGSSLSTQLTSSTEFGMPIGVGAQVLLPRGLSVGAELTYHRLFSESFAANEDIGGGDPLSVAAVLRVRL